MMQIKQSSLNSEKDQILQEETQKDLILQEEEEAQGFQEENSDQSKSLLCEIRGTFI